MKIRNKLVSNSSSSSYVIAIKKDVTKCPTCGYSEFDLLRMIDESRDIDTELLSAGDEVKEDIKLSIQELKKSEPNYYSEDIEGYENILKELEKIDLEIYNIAQVEISNHDSINTIFEEMQENNKIKVLHQEFH
jgi:4-hydroxy-3-methylbut-2-en-1-yl diphosphate synthase IspG/GcpE